MVGERLIIDNVPQVREHKLGHPKETEIKINNIVIFDCKGIEKKESEIKLWNLKFHLFAKTPTKKNFLLSLYYLVFSILFLSFLLK